VVVRWRGQETCDAEKFVREVVCRGQVSSDAERFVREPAYRGQVSSDAERFVREPVCRGQVSSDAERFVREPAYRGQETCDAEKFVREPSIDKNPLIQKRFSPKIPYKCKLFPLILLPSSPCKKQKKYHFPHIICYIRKACYN